MIARRLASIGAPLAAVALVTLGLGCNGDDTTPDCTSPGTNCGPLDGSSFDATYDAAEGGDASGTDASGVDAHGDGGADAADAHTGDAADAPDAKGG